MMMKIAIAITTITTTTITTATYIAITVHTTTTSFTYAPFVWGERMYPAQFGFLLSNNLFDGIGALPVQPEKFVCCGAPLARSILGADIKKSFLDCGCGGG